MPDLTCGFVHANSVLTNRINCLCGSQTSSIDLCKQNSLLSTKITSLCGTQTSPVLLCMQNSMLRFRITSLNLFQLSYLVFACKTPTLGLELQVPMVPRPHRPIWCMQNGVISTRITSLYGSLSWAHEGFPSPSPLREAG